MTARLTTFSDAQQSIAQFEEQQNNQPAETATPADAPTDTANIVDTTPAVPAETTTVEEQPQEQIDSVDFDLGFADTPTATAAAPAPTTSYNWKDEIKKIDKKEILKELGIDDFEIEMSEHVARGGSRVDYLNAKAIDYNQVGDEAILKEELRKKYPIFSASDIDKMYNKRYGVSEDADEEEQHLAELQRKADAHEIRQVKIQQQQSFKIPEATILQKDEAYEQWKQYKESEAQYVELSKKFFQEHAATKALNESKRVAINLGSDVPALNFNIKQPEAITQTLTDGGAMWQKLTSTETGEPDVPKQQLLALIAFNPQKFMQDIYNYGMQMGQRKLVSDGQNAQRPQTPVVPMPADQKPTYGIGKFGDRQR